MTRREKILATTLLIVLVVLGGGALFHLFVYQPMSDVHDRLNAAREQVAKKQADLAQEEKQIKDMFRVDPRLSQWEKLSVPPRNPELKKPGISPEDADRRHM